MFEQCVLNTVTRAIYKSSAEVNNTRKLVMYILDERVGTGSCALIGRHRLTFFFIRFNIVELDVFIKLHSITVEMV